LGRYFESVVDDCGRGLTYFQRAAALDRSARNLYFQGHCLEVLSRHDEARESYQAAVEVLGGTGEIFGWPFQGMARLSLDSDAVQAVGWAERALRMEPDVPENHFVLAKAYREVESMDKAVAALQTAIRLNPRYTSAYYMLFLLHAKLGRQEEARTALETFNKLKSAYATY
jgi:tetratricopeptide (TPR) repeat protein